MLRFTHQLRNTATAFTVSRMALVVLIRGCDSGGLMSSLGFTIPCEAHLSKAATCSTNITGVAFRYFSNRRSCR